MKLAGPPPPKSVWLEPPKAAPITCLKKNDHDQENGNDDVNDLY